MKSIRSVMQTYAPTRTAPAKTKPAPAHVGQPHVNLGKYLHPKKGK